MPAARSTPPRGILSDGFLPAAVGVFELAFAPIRRLFLHGPMVAGSAEAMPAGAPVLLVSNHTSWWDGFILRDVQRGVRPRGRLFTLMTTRELRRHPYLRWMGCVGLEPGNAASVLRAFRRLRDEARRDRDAVFAVFPQGSIWPPTRRPLGFERGVATLAKRLAPVTIVPIGITLEPLNRAAPTAFVSTGRAIHAVDGAPDAATLERAVEAELDAIRWFLDESGEDAVHRWPRAGAPLPRAPLAPARPDPADPASR